LFGNPIGIGLAAASSLIPDEVRMGEARTFTTRMRSFSLR
jgi:hypothetical protein